MAARRARARFPPIMEGPDYDQPSKTPLAFAASTTPLVVATFGACFPAIYGALVWEEESCGG